MESGGKVFDELAEVDTLVSDIVEDRLVAIPLVLHVTDFHLQSQPLGYLPALYHGSVFPLLRLMVFLHVDRACDTVDTLDIVSTLEVCFLNLQFDESSSEGHHSDVMSRVSLHGDDVPFLQLQVVDVVIVSLAGMFELHLYQVCRIRITRYVGKPVISVQLLILPAYGKAAQSAVTTGLYLEVFCFFHILFFFYSSYSGYSTYSYFVINSTII